MLQAAGTDLLRCLGGVASETVLLQKGEDPGSEAEHSHSNSLSTACDGTSILTAKFLDQLGKLGS